MLTVKMSYTTCIYAALFCCCALMYSATLVSAVRIRNHTHYINERTELEMLFDGLVLTQEAVNSEILPELPPHFDDNPNQASYLEALKQVAGLNTLLSDNVEAFSSSGSGESLLARNDSGMIFETIVADACSWLSTVLPQDFECTAEQLDNLHQIIEFHQLIQDTRRAVDKMLLDISPDSNFGRELECSWVNYRVLGDCRNSTSLRCQQRAIYNFFNNSYCEGVQPLFHLCIDH